MTHNIDPESGKWKYKEELITGRKLIIYTISRIVLYFVVGSIILRNTTTESGGWEYKIG